METADTKIPLIAAAVSVLWLTVLPAVPVAAPGDLPGISLPSGIRCGTGSTRG